MNGYPGRASLVEWKSHTGPRVCRSTFAAESMSCAEGMEAAIAWRGYLVELLYPNVDLRDIDTNLLPILTVTDCRSLYDTMHREGAAKAPSEKRLCVDLAALRQMYEHEVTDGDPLKVGTVPLVWVPTAEMLADPMTKVMKADALREVLDTGVLQIPITR